MYNSPSSLLSTSSKSGFSKGSLSFLGFKGLGATSATNSIRPTRESTSTSTTHFSAPEPKHRLSDDSVRTATYYTPGPTSPDKQTARELRKRPSKFSLNGILKRPGNKPRLPNSQGNTSLPPPLPTRIDPFFLYNNPVEPPHPLAHLSTPSISPKDKRKERKQKKERQISAPEVPQKDVSLYPLDTNLDSMDGIVDISRVPIYPVNSNSSGSASASFSGSHYHSRQQHQWQHAYSSSALALNSPPKFNDPFNPSTDDIPTFVPGPSHISPTTVVPHTTIGPHGKDKDLQNEPDTPSPNDGTWKAPESWAVIDAHGLQNGKLDMTAPEDSDSDDDGGAARARRGGTSSAVDLRAISSGADGSLHPSSIHAAEPIKPLRKGKESAMPGNSELTVRVYRPNERFYHLVAADVSLTVHDLLPALHRRILTGDNKTSRLFLKERGKGERIH